MTAPEAVAVAVRLFDGDTIDVQPHGGTGRYPKALDEHSRTVAPFSSCADCAPRTVRYRGTTLAGHPVEITHRQRPGTFVAYGGAALCRRCAWGRWRRAQLAHVLKGIE